MSMKTWRNEFYPVSPAKVSKRGALAHSLRKWTGLLPGATKRHRVKIEDGWMCLTGYGRDTDRLRIDDDSCALCYHYFNDAAPRQDACKACPLAQNIGGRPCDCAGDVEGPYQVFSSTKNAKPMWLALTRCQRSRVKKQKRRTVSTAR